MQMLQSDWLSLSCTISRLICVQWLLVVDTVATLSRFLGILWDDLISKSIKEIKMVN